MIFKGSFPEMANRRTLKGSTFSQSLFLCGCVILQKVMFTHTVFHTDSQSIEGMDKSLGILCVLAPQLLEYVIFIYSQHLVDVCEVQFLFDIIQQITDDISIHLACMGHVSLVMLCIILHVTCTVQYGIIALIFFSDAKFKTLGISQ